MSKRARVRRDAHIAAEGEVHSRPLPPPRSRPRVSAVDCGRRAGSPRRCSRGSRGSAVCRLPRSAPAQNALPAPVTTTAPTPSSASNVSIAATIAGHHRRRERVALAGIVERQPADALADVGDHEWFGVGIDVDSCQRRQPSAIRPRRPVTRGTFGPARLCLPSQTHPLACAPFIVNVNISKWFPRRGRK